MCHPQTKTKHPFLNPHVSISNSLWRLNSFCSLLIWLLFTLFPDRVFTFFDFSVVFRLRPALASTTIPGVFLFCFVLFCFLILLAISSIFSQAGHRHYRYLLTESHVTQNSSENPFHSVYCQ